MAVHRFIATIVLLAVAITFAFIGIAWILTTINSMMWKPEILKITKAEINQLPNGSWALTIEAINVGEGKAEIYRIVIENYEEIKEPEQGLPWVIEPGHSDIKTFILSKSYTYGALYTIRLYLKSGTVYTFLEYKAMTR
jgi:hypothetical protein